MRTLSLKPLDGLRPQREAEQTPSEGPPPALRMRRGAEHLHHLGARAVSEFLIELALAHGIETDLIARLDEWRRITPAQVRAAGGDRFAPALREVPK